MVDFLLFPWIKILPRLLLSKRIDTVTAVIYGCTRPRHIASSIYIQVFFAAFFFSSPAAAAVVAAAQAWAP